MTTFSVAGTLAANTPTSVTVRGWDLGVWVINRTGTGEIWVRLDGVNPTVAGANSFCVLGARNFLTKELNVQVRMISSTTPSYSVEGATPVVAP